MRKVSDCKNCGKPIWVYRGEWIHMFTGVKGCAVITPIAEPKEGTLREEDE